MAPPSQQQFTVALTVPRHGTRQRRSVAPAAKVGTRELC